MKIIFIVLKSLHTVSVCECSIEWTEQQRESNNASKQILTKYSPR